jgi:hypothetical protein
LMPVCIHHGAVLRMKDRICRLEGASPLALATRFLTPGEPVELLARTAFVLSIHRAIALDLRPQSKPLDRVGGCLPSDWVAGADLSAGCSGEAQRRRQYDQELTHGPCVPLNLGHFNTILADGGSRNGSLLRRFKEGFRWNGLQYSAIAAEGSRESAPSEPIPANPGLQQLRHANVPGCDRRHGVRPRRKR